MKPCFHAGIVDVRVEPDAELRFKEILQDYVKYGNDDITTRRYYRYHDEIQGLMRQAD